MNELKEIQAQNSWHFIFLSRKPDHSRGKLSNRYSEEETEPKRNDKCWTIFLRKMNSQKEWLEQVRRNAKEKYKQEGTNIWIEKYTSCTC